jgi:type IV secretion system protein VirD4
MFQSVQPKKDKPAKAQQPPPTKASTQQPPPQQLSPFQVASQIIPYLTFPLIILAIVVWKLNLGKRLSGLFFRSSNELDHHGTAGFAHVHEIKKLTTQFQPGDIKVGQVKDLVVLKQLVNLPKDLALKHTLIVGPTGAGKSRSFFLPNCHDAGNSSFVATDPKSELWEETAYNNIKPIRFAPTDPDNSAPFNFVAYCKDIDYAEQVAGAIVNAASATGDGKFWAEAEEGLLTGLLLHIAHSEMPTPTHLFNLISSGIESVSNALENSAIEDTRNLAMSYVEAKDEKKSSIIMGLAGKFNWMANPKIKRFTSSDTNAFNFGQLREKPVQVYWCLKQHDVAQLRQLTTIFFSIIITQLLKQNTGKVPVNLFFDEFANIGKIKNFENHITLFRGQGVAINAGLQDISQLTTMYDTSPGKTILNNFNNKLLLAGMQGETVEVFSKQLGNYTHVSKTESFSESGGWLDRKVTKSTGVDKHARPLMTADELRRLEDEEIILLSTNLRPVRMKRLFFTRPKAGFNKMKDWNPDDPTSQIKKQAQFKFQCGQEIPAPKYDRIKPAAGKKKSYDDI